MANKSGTNVASAVTTFTDADTYAVAYGNEIQGGRHSVVTLVDRNKIYKARRKVGMTCYVEATDLTYRLITNPTTDITEDLDWGLDIPSADNIVLNDGSTLNDKIAELEATEVAISEKDAAQDNKITAVEVAVAEKYVMFSLSTVSVGADDKEHMSRFKAKIVSIAANVPMNTILTSNIVANLEIYDGTWSIVGTATILSSDLTKSGITTLAIPKDIAIGNRLRVNIVSVQTSGIESLGIAVGLQLTK